MSFFGSNAFALPGNIVILLDEMVGFTDDDDVIAGVLAHEAGHVINQHSMRAVARSTVIAIAVADECGDGCNKPILFDSRPRLDLRRALFE